MFRRAERSYGDRLVRERFDNLDMLAWFGEDERNACGSCGERACVTLNGAIASFCLACAAITVDGTRIDRDGRLAAEQ